MRTDPRADEVRDIVERVFYRFSGPRYPRLYQPAEDEFEAISAENAPLSSRIDETIVIDRGRYVARNYRTEGQMAMWLVPAGILQFYDDRGRMLATINLFQSLRPQKIAA